MTAAKNAHYRISTISLVCPVRSIGTSFRIKHCRAVHRQCLIEHDATGLRASTRDSRSWAHRETTASGPDIKFQQVYDVQRRVRDAPSPVQSIDPIFIADDGPAIERALRLLRAPAQQGAPRVLLRSPALNETKRTLGVTSGGRIGMFHS
jgi:hypothetical protein